MAAENAGEEGSSTLTKEAQRASSCVARCLVGMRGGRVAWAVRLKEVNFEKA